MNPFPPQNKSLSLCLLPSYYKRNAWQNHITYTLRNKLKKTTLHYMDKKYWRIKKMKITSRDYGIKIACESHWVLTFSHRSKINKKTATTTKKEEQEMWKQTKKKNHFKHVTKRFWFLSRIYIQTKVKQNKKES